MIERGEENVVSMDFSNIHSMRSGLFDTIQPIKLMTKKYRTSEQNTKSANARS